MADMESNRVVMTLQFRYFLSRFNLINKKVIWRVVVYEYRSGKKSGSKFKPVATTLKITEKSITKKSEINKIIQSI